MITITADLGSRVTLKSPDLANQTSTLDVNWLSNYLLFYIFLTDIPLPCTWITFHHYWNYSNYHQEPVKPGQKESNTCFNSISVSIPYWNYAHVSKEMCTLSDNNFNFAFNIWGRFTVDLLIQSKLLMIWSSWKDFKGSHCELNWKKFCVYTLTVCSKILE